MFHPPGLSSDAVRLTSETGRCSGIPSVKSNGSWIPFCERDLTQQNAEVLCRELRCGFPVDDHLALGGNPGGKVGSQNIQCGGQESVLLDCQWLTSTRKECSPPQRVTLTCSGMSPAVVFSCLGIVSKHCENAAHCLLTWLLVRCIGLWGVGSPKDS